ncbi:unnamed protein product, partial [Ixodes hexagonus]
NLAAYTAISWKPSGERPSNEEMASQKGKTGDRVWTPGNVELVRKGIIGDWRNHFSDDQVKRLKDRIDVKTRGTDVMTLWKDCDIPYGQSLVGNCVNGSRQTRHDSCLSRRFLSSSVRSNGVAKSPAILHHHPGTLRAVQRQIDGGDPSTVLSCPEVEGFYLHITFPEDCVRSALRYKPQPGDIFIVSYPKCGTTWMQHIVYNIFNGRAPPTDVVSNYREMPFLELQGADSARDMPRPGAIKTHMPFRFQPFSKDAKYIYICRNPYDCCVSFFYHTKGMPEYEFQDGTFDQFFEMFVDGKADFGDYFDHVLSWYEHRDDPNVFFLTYEDLKKDTVTWVLKIADFIGEEYGRRLRNDRKALDMILDKTTINAMQQDVNNSFKRFYEEIRDIPEEERPQWVGLVKEAMGENVLQNAMDGNFVRKGVVGDWKNHFSADQIRRLKERIELKTRGTDLMNDNRARWWRCTTVGKAVLITRGIIWGACHQIVRNSGSKRNHRQSYSGSTFSVISEQRSAPHARVPMTVWELCSHSALAVKLVGHLRGDAPFKQAPLSIVLDGYYLHVAFTEECVRSAMAYKPVPGDVFIVSYPKCGTTWLQHIVYNIFNGRAPPKSITDSWRELPFLELQGADSVRDMPRPGAIKTHMPFRFQPFSKDAKYIYICRNPYDCCVSFFHHTKMVSGYQFQDGTFDEFLELFIEGKADFGDYMDHLLSWYEHREDPNVLFLTYEDLKKDTRSWVLKIADFLGEEYGRKMRADQGLLDSVLNRTSLKTMQEELNATVKENYRKLNETPKDEMPEWVKRSMDAIGEHAAKEPVSGDFVRKGAVGDWKNHFSAEQAKRLKEHIERKARGSDVMDLWKDIELP